MSKTYKCKQCAFTNTFTGRITKWVKHHTCEYYPRKVGEESSPWSTFIWPINDSKETVQALQLACYRARISMWDALCSSSLDDMTRYAVCARECGPWVTNDGYPEAL